MNFISFFCLLCCLAAQIIVHDCHELDSDCGTGACDPPTGELLTGRADRLTATSQQNDHPVAHLIVSNSTKDKYFESEENVESVSIRLDLEDSMLLYGVSIQFMESEDKPDSIIFERSVDFGSRFRSYHYAARDCEDVFSMASGERTAAKDIVCETMNGTTKNIHFKVIPEDDQSPIDEQFYFSKITNLRINLTDFGKQSNRKSYRISKIRVYGSCLCYGHANQCVTGSDGRITPTCLCQHNTNGTNCEICQELYNDRPWSIALEKEKNECIKCNCSDRAESCIFDPQVYETSGKKSGGVCLGCTNSTGFACQTCRSFYYADGNACRPCGCSDVGSLSNLCDGKTGQCDCLPRYSGRDCATRSPS